MLPVEAFKRDADAAAEQGMLFSYPHGPARPKGKAQAAAAAKAKCASSLMVPVCTVHSAASEAGQAASANAGLSGMGPGRKADRTQS